MKVRPAYRGEIVFRFRTRMLAEAVLQDSAIADAFGPLFILGRDFLRRLTQESWCQLVAKCKKNQEG